MKGVCNLGHLYVGRVFAIRGESITSLFFLLLIKKRGLEKREWMGLGPSELFLGTHLRGPLFLKFESKI